MKSLTRPSFWRAYDGLDSGVRKPRGEHSSCLSRTRTIRLCDSKLGGYEHIWSVRVNEQYRAVGERANDTITWVWIGSHNDFDNLFG